MKSTVNKITEGAKRRDTIGRNKVYVLHCNSVSGLDLLSIQDSISSDNVEKITNVILYDGTNNKSYLLKYRILEIGDFKYADAQNEAKEDSKDGN